jgi:hypothetical protein
MLAMSALAASGCGGGKTFANQPKPAAPVDLSVYINNSRVSVSPSSVGAGPVVFTVTNQSDSSASLTIRPRGNSGGQSLGDTGPINPQGTAQVTINFTRPGDYTVATGAHSTTDASLSGPSAIAPAIVHVGRQRASSGSDLLSP